ncbi:histidine triad protein [Granulicatella balaenopterae]|uniref:Histidine triad protein n=1 Tax=Granulicatella balaenopterae TaxID=137733 RepID=A0A1H9GXH3_9LACT|nr:pneumococcal-type histidine triad protein [Granulicatella balaenopterae]SEQ54812.1 histidine triad protein [Granulicatella balaenopterae]
MKKISNSWPKYLLAAGLGATIATGGQYILSSMVPEDDVNNRVQYISEGVNVENQSHQKTPEEISLEEGIDAEQIVVKITDDGYVTSHGDHFHYYNGKVPYDAIISEELLLQDSNYQLKDEDIQYELADGYMLKINGKYFVYVKDRKVAKNIRTKEDIKEQRDRIINGSTHKHPVAANTTGEGEVRYTTDDGYVFTVESIVQDVGDAFICSHGDHFHYIPKSDLSAKELREANQYLYGTTNSGGHGITQVAHYIPPKRNTGGVTHIVAKPVQPQQPVEVTKDFQQLLQDYYKLPKDQRHVEGDGLVFDPMQVTIKNSFGYVIPHGDHFHIIPPSQLSALEIQLADMALAQKQNNVVVVTPTPDKPNTGGEVVTPDKPNTGGEVVTPDKPNTGGEVVTPDKPNTGGEVVTPTPDKPNTGGEVVTPDKPNTGGEVVTPDKPNTGGEGETPEYPDGIKPELLMEIKDLPYNLSHADMEVEGGFRVPHWDHYHYVQFSWLDEKDRDKIIATVRYLLLHPELKPEVEDGWGGADVNPGQDITEPDEPTTTEEDLEQMIERVTKALTISEDDFWEYTTPIAQKYHTSIDQLKIDNQGKVTVTTDKGKVFVNIYTAEEISETAEVVKPTPENPDKPNTGGEGEIPTELDRLHAVVPLHTEKIDMNGKPSKKGTDGKPYDTSDGYIFTPESVFQIDHDAVLAWHITPEHGKHIHWIPLGDLEDSELEALALYYQNLPKDKKDTIKLAYDHRVDKTDKPNTGAEGETPDKPNTGSVVVTPEYPDGIKPELLMDIKDLPYNLSHADMEVESGFRVPHWDHYHYVQFSWLDENDRDKIIATVRYLLLHPELKPEVEDGWGGAEVAPGHDTTEPDEPTTTEEDFDQMVERVTKALTISEDDFYDYTSPIAQKYHTSIDLLKIDNTGKVTVTTDKGKVFVNIYTGQEISETAEVVKPAPAEKSYEELLKAYYELPKEKRGQLPNGMIFDPAKVTEKMEFLGYAIPVGKILYAFEESRLSPLEIQLAELALQRRADNLPVDVIKDPLDEEIPAPAEKTYEELLKAYYELPENKRHHEINGLVFDPEKILCKEGNEYLFNYRGELQGIYLSDLSEDERKLGELFLEKQGAQCLLPDEVDPSDVGKQEYIDLLNQLYALPKEKRHVEGDGLVFDPTTIIKKNGPGYVIPHEDHTHFIWESDLSELEVQLAELVLQRKEYGLAIDLVKDPLAENHEGHHHHDDHEDHQEPAKPAEKSYEELLKEYYALPLKDRYQDGNNFVFDPAKVIKKIVTENGLVAYAHPGLFYTQNFPASWLSPLELKLADMALERKAQGLSTTITVEKPAKPFDKPYEELLKEYYALPLEERYQDEDDFVFDPAKLTEKIIKSSGIVGYSQPESDYTHDVLAELLSPMELQLAEMAIERLSDGLPIGLPAEDTTTEPQEDIITTEPAEKSYEELLKEYYALPLDERYQEVNDFVYDPAKVVEKIEKRGRVGYAQPGTYYVHKIPAVLLSDLEVKLTEMALERKAQGLSVELPAEVEEPVEEPAEDTTTTEPVTDDTTDSQDDATTSQDITAPTDLSDQDAVIEYIQQKFNIDSGEFYFKYVFNITKKYPVSMEEMTFDTNGNVTLDTKTETIVVNFLTGEEISRTPKQGTTRSIEVMNIASEVEVTTEPQSIPSTTPTSDEVPVQEAPSEDVTVDEDATNATVQDATSGDKDVPQTQDEPTIQESTEEVA